uniref:Uncharacterized protein n=1 Tax=Nothobranchius kuhntae TaxID=321403 RepID=A0A1A8KKI3_NOTKU
MTAVILILSLFLIRRILCLRTPLRQQGGVPQGPSKEAFPFPRSSPWTGKLAGGQWRGYASVMAWMKRR